MFKSQEHDRSLDAGDATWNDAPARGTAVGKVTLTARLPGRGRAAAQAVAPEGRVQFALRDDALRAVARDPFADVLSGPYIGTSGPLPAEAAAERLAANNPARATLDPHHATAAAGVAGPGGFLPHLATIQRAFGHHDVAGVRAHTDAAAATASRDLGALAYATGDDIAFASAFPDLHTAAHEAAHVVQQRAGVHLKDGLGQAGDAYERHADAVADAVVRGDSAVSLLDSMAGGGKAGGAAAIQRRDTGGTAPGGGPAPAVSLSLSPEARAQVEASTTLKMAAAFAHEQLTKLRSGRTTAGQAAREMQTILARCAPAVAALAAYHRKTHPAGAAGTAPAASAGAEQAQIDQDSRELAMANLDALVGDTLEIARGLDDQAPEVRPMVTALDRVTQTAAGLDWSRPASMDAARDRKFAREACPAGENDESPRTCTLADAERVERRVKIIARLDKLASLVFEECKKRGDEFRKAIEADHKLDELLVSIAVELLVTAATAGLGAPAATGAGAVAAEVPKKAGPSGAQKFATDLGKTLTKTTLTKVPKVTGPGGDKGDEREDTIGALDALAAQFHKSVEASVHSLASLDDDQLTHLELSLDHYPEGQIADQVRTFADHYLKQVAPIGKDHPFADSMFTDGGWHRDDKQAVGRAVKIIMPSGKLKLALIDEITDKNPGLRKAARTVGVAADRLIGDEDDSLLRGGTYRQRQDQWIDEPHVERHFIRWIDDPRMAAVAGADAATVPADKVLGLPLDAMFSLDQAP